MTRVVGQCGKCGGQVTVPTVWMGVHPPAPQCNRCHAVVKSTAPVLEMQPLPDPLVEANRRAHVQVRAMLDAPPAKVVHDAPRIDAQSFKDVPHYDPDKPTLLLDCDGVLANFHHGACEALYTVTGRRHRHEEVTSWHFEQSFNLTPEETTAVRALFERPGFCAGLPPYPDAVEAIPELREIANIYPLTAPYKSMSWVAERDWWLKEHFGFDRKTVTHTEMKWLTWGNVFVDDKIDHVTAWAKHWPAGHAVLWQRPYNVNERWPAHLHTDNWRVVYDLLKAV